MLNMLIKQRGKEQTVTACEGALIADVLRAAHALVDTPCGGKGICGQCKVKASGGISAPDADELRLLGAAERAEGVRLACKARLTGDAQITLTTERALAGIAESGFMPAFEKDTGDGYGVAVDIGTTSVVAYLYDLARGELLDTVSVKNPQTVFGADVISRIEQSLAGKGQALSDTITRELARLIALMTGRKAVAPEAISQVVITGNTTMLYLLTGQDVDCLSHAPFLADTLYGGEYAADALGLASAAPGARVYLPRCISAFVGADITTAILASELTAQTAPSLLVDIGTNGEIAFSHDGTLLSCSTAAGPAFEGAGIQMGMNAVRGAIDAVKLTDGKITYTTLQNAPAIGICGSGLIDAVAVLLDAGIIDETGLILDDGHAFEAQIIEYDGNCAFQFDGCDVILTQKDIRAVQLAKSAICAGMLTLVERAGLTGEQVGRLFIAGGFGSYISVENAVKIGLIPAELAGKTLVIGNAAISGAAMVLQSAAQRARSLVLAQAAQTVDLSTSPVFMERYVDCMMFESV